MAEAVAIKPVTHFPVRQTSEATENGELTRWQRILLAYGVRTTMANPQTPSMPLNVTTIGTWVVIMVAVLGGFWWAFTQGREVGKQEETIRLLNERLTRAESDAAEAKKFQIYAAAGSDEQNGHKPNQKKEK